VKTHQGWPYGQLDVPALRADGWSPIPFRDFVLKVHQRCNLACDYCYVYNMADRSWKQRPVTMSPDVARAAGDRFADHVQRHALTEISVVLHGGEPLLAGAARLRELMDGVRRAVPGSCRVRFGMQTNGVLLDAPLLESLGGRGLLIGVSLDGPSHDAHRRLPNGRGSAEAVARALDLLGSERFRDMYGGLLCTVDPASDPIECYENLLASRPPRIDFLLPHANWSDPPVRLTPPALSHGEWLVRIFDRWYGAPEQETGVRLFQEIINLTLGGGSRSEQVGLSPAAIAVVESDGAIEQVDSLKSAYSGACDTGLSVMSDTFDAALDHPGIIARQIGIRALSDTCRSCRIHPVCGAGHYAHRYRAGAGFRNPSVYCPDLITLIGHVLRRISRDIAELRAA